VSEGELRPVWSYFGYDEANYTYRENGKKLLGGCTCSCTTC